MGLITTATNHLMHASFDEPPTRGYRGDTYDPLYDDPMYAVKATMGLLELSGIPSIVQGMRLGMKWLLTKAGFKIAVKTETTALRKVGSVLESVEDVMANPNLLEGKSYGYIRNMLGNSKNWVNDNMRRSSRAQGWILREMNQAGTDFTGRMIQYHPGTPRHYGGMPYWKVSSGSGTFRILQ